MQIGFDVLALGHPLWPTRTMIEVLPPGSGLGCFFDTFGNVIPNLSLALDSGKFPLVRIQMWWSNQHVIVPLGHLSDRLPAVRKLSEKYPHVEFYVSHSCEYNETNAAAVRQRVEMIQQMVPRAMAVNSCYRGATIPHVVTERHGDVRVKAGNSVSMDGTDIRLIDVREWKRKNREAALQFAWGLGFNMKNGTEQDKLPPKERKYVPNKNYFKEIVRLANE